MTLNGIKYCGRDSPISGNIQEFWNCWVNSSCIVLLSLSRESVFDIITASQNSASLCGPMGTTCFIMKTYTNLFQSVLFHNEQPLLAITWTQLELAQEPLLWDLCYVLALCFTQSWYHVFIPLLFLFSSWPPEKNHSGNIMTGQNLSGSHTIWTD